MGHDFKLENTGGLGLNTKVLIDGHDVSSALTGVEFTAEIGDVMRVILHLALTKFTQVESNNASLFISEQARTLLEYFGWTPPPEGFVPGSNNPNPWEKKDENK